jgi:hypothetical protein
MSESQVIASAVGRVWSGGVGEADSAALVGAGEAGADRSDSEQAGDRGVSHGQTLSPSVAESLPHARRDLGGEQPDRLEHQLLRHARPVHLQADPVHAEVAV